MSFIQPCFIRKNTPELRKKLEGLGYEFSGADHIELDNIVTFPQHNTFSVFAAYHFNIYDDSFKIVWKEYVDCGTNEELFLALAALRDDTNENQWFISNVDIFTECYNNEWRLYENWYNTFTIEDLNSEISPIRKASVEEIIEHFKNK